MDIVARVYSLDQESFDLLNVTDLRVWLRRLMKERNRLGQQLIDLEDMRERRAKVSEYEYGSYSADKKDYTQKLEKMVKVSRHLQQEVLARGE
jgi:hypothetical protein